MDRFRRLATSLTVIVSLGGGFALIASGATPAQAINCGTTFSNDKQYFEWVHQSGGAKDVDGVRAGIKFRLDGVLCDFSVLHRQGTAIWIGILGTGGASKIVQMGFVKQYNPFGVTETCFFWAIEGGSANNYHCTGMSDDSSENFYIHTWNNGTQYILADCGLGGNNTDYSNCVVKSSSQAVWAEPFGLSSEEELYGACDAHTFGGQSDQEKIGGVTGDPILPLQGRATSDTGWTARSWGRDDDVQGCGDPPYHYQLKEANPSRGLNWYDTRNSG